MTPTVQSGLLGLRGAVAPNLFGRALAALSHRGPDAWSCVADIGGVLLRRSGAGRPSFDLDAAAMLGAVQTGDAEPPGQPAYGITQLGPLALALDGALLNADSLRDDLLAEGAVLRSESAAELLLRRVARSRHATPVSALVDALYDIEGAWSAILLGPQVLVGARDPHGFRPLVLGRVGDAVGLCSEPAALLAVGGEIEREVAPGEMVIIDDDGVQTLTPLPPRAHRRCIVDLLQLTRPRAPLFGCDPAQARLSVGRILARSAPVAADVVVPLPGADPAAASAFAQVARLPLRAALIDPPGEGLSAIAGLVRNLRVVLIAPPTTPAAHLHLAIARLRQSGANEVHLRQTGPALRHPCPYGLALPAPPQAPIDALASHTRLSLEALTLATGERGFCDGCFSGIFPIPPRVPESEQQLPLFQRER